MDDHELSADTRAFWVSLFVISMVLICMCLGSCSSALITELAKDPATVSVHQVVTAPGWSVTTDYVRNNSTGASASAGGNGTNASIPPGSILATPPAASGPTPK